jgi:hypothetical protein
MSVAHGELLIVNKIINELHGQAIDAVKSNEYNFNDTAVRSKTFFEAVEIVKGFLGDKE